MRWIKDPRTYKAISSQETQSQSAFDQLMIKYTKQKADSLNRLIKKEVWSLLKQVYVLKKEVPAAPMETLEETSIIIGVRKMAPSYGNYVMLVMLNDNMINRTNVVC